ncbi:hypothetical protein P171DRAFT_477084 [Karstenula rhodostoma CBS 690.94]|uniref:F-box domain-containing protein n=1 Tax=Karstenula rhodostoma CBS 690.94 TaxID=1392251 RepID=A0A9P4P5F5_9PLEO|nr:hypothetical protein P171DRAFT_477084 [Karstenula rhodostoma CBS 690.94]
MDTNFRVYKPRACSGAELLLRKLVPCRFPSEKVQPKMAKRVLDDTDIVVKGNEDSKDGKKRKTNVVEISERPVDGNSNNKRPLGSLDLAAEIRNLIHYYADESDHACHHYYIPLLTNRSTEDALSLPCHLENLAHSSRKFFGLTQTCKKIRAEYLPLWMRNASLRVLYEEFGSYVKTFHNKKQGSVQGPKQLLISYDLGAAYEAPETPRMNLLRLLRFRACHPSTGIEVVPHDEAGWYNPERGPEYRMDEFCSECDQADTGNTWSLCDHLKEVLEEYQYEALAGYVHLEEVNGLISHDNPIWVADIASGFIAEVYMKRMKLDNYVELGLDTEYCSSWESADMFDQKNQENRVFLRIDTPWFQYRKDIGLDDERMELFYVGVFYM